MKIGTRFRTAGGAIVEVKKARLADDVVAVCDGCGERSPEKSIRLVDIIQRLWINPHLDSCRALPSK